MDCGCVCQIIFVQELSVGTAVVVPYTWSRSILCSLGPAEIMVVSHEKTSDKIEMQTDKLNTRRAKRIIEQGALACDSSLTNTSYRACICKVEYSHVKRGTQTHCSQP